MLIIHINVCFFYKPIITREINSFCHAWVKLLLEIICCYTYYTNGIIIHMYGQRYNIYVRKNLEDLANAVVSNVTRPYSPAYRYRGHGNTIIFILRYYTGHYYYNYYYYDEHCVAYIRTSCAFDRPPPMLYITRFICAHHKLYTHVYACK